MQSKYLFGERKAGFTLAVTYAPSKRLLAMCNSGGDSSGVPATQSREGLLPRDCDAGMIRP